jgi:predicted Zn-dependent peptidase
MTLANGLTVLVCERPEAPVFSFFTHVDVGPDREVPGITGLAHMFEHMAFKGTDRIGTKDYEHEKQALEAVEAAYAAYDGERRKERRARRQEGGRAREGVEGRDREADGYVVPNEFGEIVDREGGVGLNASTSSDDTATTSRFRRTAWSCGPTSSPSAS